MATLSSMYYEVVLYWIMDHAIIMAITKVGGSVVNFGFGKYHLYITAPFRL